MEEFKDHNLTKVKKPGDGDRKGYPHEGARGEEVGIFAGDY